MKVNAMMGHREKMKGGDEYDALHRRSRRIVCGLDRAGVTKRAKNKFNRRVRRDAKVDARREAADD